MIRKRLQRLKVAQSILEYICVAFVFATVGIVAFISANRGTVVSARGGEEISEDSLIGKILEGGTPSESYIDSESRDDISEPENKDWSQDDETEYLEE